MNISTTDANPRHCSQCDKIKLLGYGFSITGDRPHTFICEDCIVAIIKWHEAMMVFYAEQPYGIIVNKNTTDASKLTEWIDEN